MMTSGVHDCPHQLLPAAAERLVHTVFGLSPMGAPPVLRLYVIAIALLLLLLLLLLCRHILLQAEKHRGLSSYRAAA